MKKTQDTNALLKYEAPWATATDLSPKTCFCTSGNAQLENLSEEDLIVENFF